MPTATWADLSARMDDLVDASLGDDMTYVPNTSASDEIKGFALPRSTPGYDVLDDALGSRPRVKVSKELVPQPLKTDRITCAALGPGTWRPSGDEPSDQGRYWLIDVQKV